MVTTKAAPIPKAAESVMLAELRRKIIRITIEGTSPLITHAWSAKAIRQIEDKQQKKASSGREAKVPADECEQATYRNEKDEACVPSRAIKGAIVSAATSIGDISRYPKTKLRQGIFICGDLLPIKGPKPKMRTDMVSLPRGGADVRYRPEWERWEITFEVEFNEAAFSQEEVVNLLELAGFAVGIGEWRPEKDGNNGRFRVKR